MIVAILIMLLNVILVIIFSVLKADWHFRYVKSIAPDRYANYDSYFSMFDFTFNWDRFALLLPFFNRQLKLESSSELKRKGDTDLSYEEIY